MAYLIRNLSILTLVDRGFRCKFFACHLVVVSVCNIYHPPAFRFPQCTLLQHVWCLKEDQGNVKVYSEIYLADLYPVTIW